MSDLLNKASLVMVPSGYKEDTVYSVVPSNGNGDLSFTRASNGTRVNSAGLVEVCPWNLAGYSEDFSNAYWDNYALTITANTTTAPNGTATADTFTSTGNFGGVMYKINQQSAGTFTTSVYVKAGNFDLIRVGITDNGSAVDRISFLNLSTLAITNFSGAVGSVESVGNGWYRFIVTFTSTGNFNLVYGLQPEGTSGKTAYFWGAQLNIGATAKPYFPTTDRLNVPRLTYQNGGGGCPSLLLEKQSTNELSYSEQFDNADWSVKDNLSVTANATTSPDGTQNADKLVEDSSNNQHRVYRSASGASKMFSFFAKPSGRSWVSVLCNNGDFTWFDIANGQVGTVAATSTATIENVGNGWYRCAVYNTHGTFGALIQLATGNNVTSYQGDGTSGAFVWGAQLEASSYKTSYIPTTSSSATRVADACFKTGISSLIGQTEGVLFCDFEFVGYASVAQWIAFLIGASGDYIGFYTNSSNKIVMEVSSGGVSMFLDVSITLNVGTRYKMAVAYKANDFAFYVNGSQISIDASGSVPSCSEFNFNYNTTAANIATNKYNQAALFKTRLTNAELASLTTI